MYLCPFVRNKRSSTSSHTRRYVSRLLDPKGSRHLGKYLVNHLIYAHSFISYPFSRSILHDENTYPDPFKFDPERYLNQDKPIDRLSDPSLLAFGFGRRICPGMHLADNSIFITVASILSVFNISKCRDANGEEITPIIDYSGFIRYYL